MPSLEPSGENAAPSAKAIATARTRETWRQQGGGWRRSKCEDDREGQFHTQAFDRYSRYEPQVAQGLTEMFVAGVSTRHPSGKWLRRSWESRLVPLRSVVSTRRSPSNLTPGDSVGF